MEYSYFYGFYSNQPQLCYSETWEHFCETMKAISEVEGYKPTHKEYDKTQGLISSAIYANEDDKRTNDNVTGWDILILDIDDTDKSLSQINTIFQHFDRIFYSSASCTHSKLKLRVIIPLNTTAPKEKLKEVWYAAQMWCEGLVDEQTKDMSRMHYVPARYTNKGDQYRHFFHVEKGIKLDWEALVAKYPMPPEAERFKKDNPLRKLKRSIFVDNNPLPEFNIQADNCPFVDDRMVNDYMLTPIGSHHTAIYKFMVQICYKAQAMNYPLDVDELADMGKQMDDMDGGFYETKKMMNNAVDAMSYVGI